MQDIYDELMPTGEDTEWIDFKVLRGLKRVYYRPPNCDEIFERVVWKELQQLKNISMTANLMSILLFYGHGAPDLLHAFRQKYLKSNL